MFISTLRDDGTEREFRKLIWRERALWVAGVVFPILLTITLFVF